MDMMQQNDILEKFLKTIEDDTEEITMVPTNINTLEDFLDWLAGEQSQ
jgi:restriction endonuclease S subunit